LAKIHGKGAPRATFAATIDDAPVLALRPIITKLHREVRRTTLAFSTRETLGSQIDQFTGAIALVVTPITLIRAHRRGIVVMNIMLVSAPSARSKIGLRKALGARRKQVLVQFLIESSMLCALGRAGACSPLPVSLGVTVFTPDHDDHYHRLRPCSRLASSDRGRDGCGLSGIQDRPRPINRAHAH